jgi:hypothetical protein
MTMGGGSYGSSITIEEVTGTRKWSITLVGAGLPHQGVGWGIENRIPTNWYPGNFTEGTQQVIGPTEADTHMTGIWRRTLLLRSPATITPGGQATQTATPGTLSDFLEQLAIGGARLRVTWTQTKTELVPGATPGGTVTPSGPTQYQKVREGRIKSFMCTPLTGDDIKWDVTWTWVGRGAGVMQKGVSSRDSEATSSAAAVQSAITDALNLTGVLAPSSAQNPLVPLSASPDTLGQLETLDPDFVDLSAGFNADLLTLQTSFSLSTSIGLSINTTPSQINNSVLNLSVDAVATCNDFTDAVGEVPFEVMSTSDDASDVAFAAGVAAGQVLQAWTLRANAQAAATKVRAALTTNPGGGAAGVQTTAGQGPGQLLGVYRTREGDTPQRVAKHWYQNADRALDLLQANHLPLGTPYFSPGTVLLIPALRSSTSQG